jgi:hypothetical protein
LAPPVWISAIAGLERIGPLWLARFVFPIAFAMVFFLAFFQLLFFVCPRCKNTFFAPGGFRNAGVLLAMFFFNRCQTCGLRAGDLPEGENEWRRNAEDRVTRE